MWKSGRATNLVQQFGGWCYRSADPQDNIHHERVHRLPVPGRQPGTATMKPSTRWPALRGGLIALTAALLFGVSTPLVQRFGVGLGSFTTAALLYAGAALIGALLRRPVESEARVQRRDAPRLALIDRKSVV